MLEVEAADLRHRVDEALAHARRRGREEQEDGLGAEVREEAGVPEPLVARISPPQEEQRPSDRQRDVEDRVAGVEPVQEARVAEDGALHRGLDVDAEPLLERDDALGVAFRPDASTAVEHELAHEQIDAVRQEDQCDLPPGREPCRHEASLRRLARAPLV